jgi:hypothetical protein
LGLGEWPVSAVSAVGDNGGRVGTVGLSNGDGEHGLAARMAVRASQLGSVMASTTTIQPC